MRRFFLLLLLLITFRTLFAQQYDGVYVEDTIGNFIQIKGDHFVLRTIINGNFSVVANDGDTIADCKIKPISADLFEITSSLRRKDIIQSMTIEQFNCDTIDWRETKYVIDAPHVRRPLKVTFEGDRETCSFIFRRNYDGILTTVRYWGMWLSFSPIEPDIRFNTDEFYGVPVDLGLPFGWQYGSYKIFHFPLLTDAYFRTLTITGEYVRVVKDCLIWRGHIFKKQPEGLLPSRRGWIKQEP